MLRGTDVKLEKKEVAKKKCMTHGNPGNVLTTVYSVSCVRFAVLIPRRLQTKTLNQAFPTPGFSFYASNKGQHKATRH
jgi:hypothetical protein